MDETGSDTPSEINSGKLSFLLILPSHFGGEERELMEMASKAPVFFLIGSVGRTGSPRYRHVTEWK